MGRFFKLAAIGIAALMTSGCWYHLHYQHGPVFTGPQVVYVRHAPPSPLRPHIPPRPIASAIWIEGYWRWTGLEYRWVDGFWEHNPPRGKVWIPDRWIHTKRGWYHAPGRWQ